MLQRLTIEDYGLIPRAEIAFAPGATMFTGETGSGKTMVLGALAFALGERSSPEVVRRGRSRAVVTLEFAPDAELRQRLAQDGFELDPDEDATISREVWAESGKSSIRVNGRTSTASYVREIAAGLVDIAGQHEAQRLLMPSYHLELLDRFGGAEAASSRERVAALYLQRSEIAEKLRALELDERRAQEQLAFAKFALQEIEAVAPQLGEDEHLAQRRLILNNAEKIAIALRTAHEAVAGEQNSAIDGLGAASSALHGIAGIAGAYEDLANAIDVLQSEAADAAAQVVRELDTVEFDAGELDAINARLEAIDTLKRKYGGSLEAVLHSVPSFQETVELMTDKEERRAELQREFDEMTKRFESTAQRLSQVRRAAAEQLRKSVEREFAELAMPSGRFAVDFAQLNEIGPAGAESAQFSFAATKGEALRPLARVASGGELSRMLLALVVALAGARGATALIFDEIDTGVGGVTATAVGVRLGRLAQHAQVVCVTHLAQIASWADRHYVLEKTEGRSAAAIAVRQITGDADRTAELARMLSGESHDTALAHARTLLAQTNARRLAV